MTFYADTAADATALIAEFGQEWTLSRANVTGGGPADPTGGTSGAPTEATVKAVVLPMESSQVGQDIPGGAIRSTDAMIYIAPDATTAPANGDTVTDGTNTWRILRASVLRPGGVVVLYDCVGRK